MYRRTFLTGGAMAAAAVPAARMARAAKANDRIRVGLIGCGGRGRGVAAGFAGLKEVEVAAVCDPDSGHAASTSQLLPNKPPVQVDMRRLLDDKSIDAVIVATPDHWHAPAAILAAEAGKHVYVEKPCSHNVREGRLLVDAARRNKRLVQHGTQSRSMSLIAHAVRLLGDGIIGDVLTAKAWNVQKRGPIGKAQPSKPPSGVDYDLWVGPASWLPYQSNRFHYTWHWWHNFGTGDMGNDGVHELDIARWGLGVTKHPSTVAAIGGKLAYDDDQQFPDSQYVQFDYPGDGRPGSRRQLIFEMRLWSRYGLQGFDNGNAFYGTSGWMLLSKRGALKVYDERNRELELKPSDLNLPAHDQNFINAIRGEQPLTAEIEIGHLSATLCHLGNVATCLGRSLAFDPRTETVADDAEANRMLGRKYRDGGHWAIPAAAAG